MAEKRPNKEDGTTPGKPKNKLACQEKSSRKTLFPDDSVSGGIEEKKRTNVSWTKKEEVALVQYICLYHPEAYTDMWPKTKDKAFWQNCADAVNHLCKSKRSGWCIFC